MDKILEEKMKIAIKENKIITEVSDTGLEINYFEDEETGILYPIFKFEDEENFNENEMPYAVMWKDYMLENKQHHITKLIMTGNLIKKMIEVEEKAQDYKEKIVKQLLEKNPMPPSNETLKRGAHLTNIYEIAEEMVIKDIVETIL